MTDKPRTSVTIRRTDLQQYEATNSRGATVQIGGEGFSPVELLLAGLAACTAVDVDVMTSRRAEPDVFEVTASAHKSTDPVNHLEDVAVAFKLRFPEGEAGDEARARIDVAVRASHNKDCTVSQTIERPTPVEFSVDR